jgi:hypothetical protein
MGGTQFAEQGPSNGARYISRLTRRLYEGQQRPVFAVRGSKEAKGKGTRGDFRIALDLPENDIRQPAAGPLLIGSSPILGAKSGCGHDRSFSRRVCPAIDRINLALLSWETRPRE